MSVAAPRIYTPADLLSLPDAQNCELIDGELVEKHKNFLACCVQANVFMELAVHCNQTDLGFVLPSSLGYQCFPWAPKNVRKPDVSFIRRERFSADFWEQEHLSIAPDLAVEVVSPCDLAVKTDRKIEEFLRVGISLIWLVHPQLHVIMVFCKDGSTARLRDGDELSGEDVVPGFSCRVGELFPVIAK